MSAGNCVNHLLILSRLSSLQELHMGTNVSYCCGTDVVPSTRVLAVTLLADSAFEDELKKEYPWITTGIQKMSSLTSGLLTKKEDVSESALSYGASPYDSIKPYLNCLGLAAENRDPVGLEDVLQFIHQFECTDKRDRLYGTLALIKWNPPGEERPIPRPVPDYEKDAFRLATDIYRMLRPGPWESDTKPVHRALHWVEHLFDIFGLDPSAMQDALVKRYTSPVKVHTEEETNEDDFERTLDSSWRAMRICDLSSPEAKEQYSLHMAEPVAGDRFVTLFDHENTPFAQAPLQTVAGDFYIEMDSWAIEPESWSHLGIIVKRSTEPPFHIHNRHTLLGLARRFVSQTCIARRLWGNQEHERFYHVTIHWDIDDIFLLYATTCRQSELDIEYLVLMRLSDPERNFSSFAHFQRCWLEPELDRIPWCDNEPPSLTHYGLLPRKIRP
jgi:hypothetical protein